MSDYDDLAARAERGELTPIPGTIKQGQEAIDETRRLLMEVTGTATRARSPSVARHSARRAGNPLSSVHGLLPRQRFGLRKLLRRRTRTRRR
jgi:hypothetical protein